LELDPSGALPSADLVQSTSGLVTKFHDDFLYIRVGVRLILSIGKVEVTIPYEENTFKYQPIVHSPDGSSSLP
jgi:hypothetical protein